MMHRPKPRTLIDVFRRGGVEPYSMLARRIVFNDRGRISRARLARYAASALRGAVTLGILFHLLTGGVNAPLLAPHLLVASTVQDERAVLEEELRQVEAQIGEYQSTIDNLKNQASSLKNELKRLDAKIAQINLRIKATNLSLTKLNQEIADTQAQIAVTESEIGSKKDTLAAAIREIYQQEDTTMVELLLRTPQFSDFFGELNSLLMIQDNTRLTLERVTELKNRLLDERETLSLERADVVALKEFNESQKVALSDTRTQKDKLLAATKGQESAYQKLLTNSIKNAAEIRSRIFSLLGGGELTFEKALELATLAEQATGVRAALLLAILDRESALGKNVGRCPYYDPDKNRYYMHPTRDVPIFLEITKSLDIDPADIMVSCPNRDGTYGGAMGPSQFIPSTWIQYKDRIAQLSSHNPPSPWNNTDAFLATALYLGDMGADRGTTAAEREAAARYYAGGRWRSYLWTYGDWVVSRAASYQKDIDILNN